MDEKMDEKTEEKNKHRMYELIEKHFGLEKESLNLIKFNLFEQRETPEEYEFIHESSDLRVYYPLDDFLDDSCLEQTYKDYGIFRKHFIDEIKKYSITFENYKKNSIDHKKNKYKLIKFLFKQKTLNFLKEKIIINLNLNDKQKKIVDNFCERTHFKKIRDFFMSLRTEENEKIKKSIEEIDFEITLLDNIIKQIIKIKSTTKSGLKLVISRNFADYFLCSTGQSFTSCLNLNSDHGGAFWTGLPGLITDKNRAIVYITDGNSITFEGITIPKMINRSWILTAREKTTNKLKNISEKNKYFINLVKIYPPNDGMKESFKNFLEKIFENRTISYGIFSDDVIGKYYFKPIWFEDNRSCFIFQDSTNFSLGKKNKAKEMSLLYYNSFNHNGFQSIYKNGNKAPEFSFSKGLDYLINNNKNMMEIDSNNEHEDDEETCDRCGNGGNDVDYRNILDRTVCDECYWEQVIICHICDEEILYDNAFPGPNNLNFYYCNNCYNEIFSDCYECGNDYKADYLLEGPDGNCYCERCFWNKFSRCNECDEIYEKNGNDLCVNCIEQKKEEKVEENVISF